MHYRTFDRTGIAISEVSLGAEHLEFVEEKQAVDVVSAALDYGMNHIEVFPPSPYVRTNVGKAIKGRRDKVLLTCQLGSVMQGDQYAKTRDTKIAAKYFYDFLTCTNSDYVDILDVHYVDTFDDFELVSAPGGLLDFAKKMKQEGKARMIGFSSHNHQVAQKLVSLGCFDQALFSINPAFDMAGSDVTLDDLLGDHFATIGHGEVVMNPQRQDFYAYCEQMGCGLVVMKSYAAGRLITPGTFPVTFTPAQCIAYALSRPAVKSAAVGCRTVAEVEAAMSYVTASEAERDYTKPLAGLNLSRNAHCMYCNHCLPCPVGLDIAENTKILDDYLMGAIDREEAVAKALALDVPVSACIGCEACTSRCPFAVKAHENMAKLKEMIGA